MSSKKRGEQTSLRRQDRTQSVTNVCIDLFDDVRTFPTLVTPHCKNKTSVSGSSIPVLGMKLKRGEYAFWLYFKGERFLLADK